MLWLGLAKADYVCQCEGSRASVQNSTKDNQRFLVFLDGRVLRRTTFDHLRLYFSLSPGYPWRFYSVRAEAVCIVQANREALNGCANTAGKPESNSNLLYDKAHTISLKCTSAKVDFVGYCSARAEAAVSFNRTKKRGMYCLDVWMCNSVRR